MSKICYNSVNKIINAIRSSNQGRESLWLSGYVVRHVFTRYCVQISVSIICGMTLDKSLTAKLSRMTHSCRANTSSVSTLDGRGADTAVCKKEKDGRNWLHVDPNNNCSWPQWMISLWDIIIIFIIIIKA